MTRKEDLNQIKPLNQPVSLQEIQGRGENEILYMVTSINTFSREKERTEIYRLKET